MTKKIVIFYQGHEISGGVDTVLVNLIKAWPDKGDIFEVWLNQGHKGPFIYEALGIHVRRINLLTPDDISVSPREFYLKVLRKSLWMLCHAFKYPIFLYFAISFYVALKRSSPDVVFSHNGGYPAGELNRAFVVAAKWAGIKKIFLVVHNYALPVEGPFAFAERMLDGLIDEACTGIITVSRACAQQIQETRFPRGKEIGFIYNGIAVDRQEHVLLDVKRKTLNLDAGSRVIGCIGHYEERKGHAYLIKAFHEIQQAAADLRLVIIGDPVCNHTLVLKKLVKELGLEQKVFLTGYLDAAWEYMECFDVFVFPSIAYESFGMVLLEAMLYKKPVIGTRVGGIPEVLGDAGIVVEPRNSRQMADAIKRVLNDQYLAKSLGERGYGRAVNVFRSEVMSMKYYNLIHQ